MAIINCAIFTEVTAGDLAVKDQHGPSVVTRFEDAVSHASNYNIDNSISTSPIATLE
jgi:hypothetical protein